MSPISVEAGGDCISLETILYSFVICLPIFGVLCLGALYYLYSIRIRGAIRSFWGFPRLPAGGYSDAELRRFWGREAFGYYAVVRRWGYVIDPLLDPHPSRVLDMALDGRKGMGSPLWSPLMVRRGITPKDAPRPLEGVKVELEPLLLVVGVILGVATFLVGSLYTILDEYSSTHGGNLPAWGDSWPTVLNTLSLNYEFIKLEASRELSLEEREALGFKQMSIFSDQWVNFVVPLIFLLPLNYSTRSSGVGVEEEVSYLNWFVNITAFYGLGCIWSESNSTMGWAVKFPLSTGLVLGKYYFFPGGGKSWGAIAYYNIYHLLGLGIYPLEFFFIGEEYEWSRGRYSDFKFLSTCIGTFGGLGYHILRTNVSYKGNYFLKTPLSSFYFSSLWTFTY